MKAPDFYLNNYIADELRAAFDKEDVCYQLQWRL